MRVYSALAVSLLLGGCVAAPPQQTVSQNYEVEIKTALRNHDFDQAEFLLGHPLATREPGSPPENPTTTGEMWRAGLASWRAGGDDQAIRYFKMIDALSDTIRAQPLPPGGVLPDTPIYTLSRADSGLGQLYQQRGDLVTARSYYEKSMSASKGFDDDFHAAENLGYMYANGVGGPRDKGRATEVFNKLANFYGEAGRNDAYLNAYDMLPASPDQVTPEFLAQAKVKANAQEAANSDVKVPPKSSDKAHP